MIPGCKKGHKYHWSGLDRGSYPGEAILDAIKMAAVGRPGKLPIFPLEGKLSYDNYPTAKNGGHFYGILRQIM